MKWLHEVWSMHTMEHQSATEGNKLSIKPHNHLDESQRRKAGQGLQGAGVGVWCGRTEGELGGDGTALHLDCSGGYTNLHVTRLHISTCTHIRGHV